MISSLYLLNLWLSVALASVMCFCSAVVLFACVECCCSAVEGVDRVQDELQYELWLYRNRKWLQQQKMRSKAKKKVDTKASAVLW